jgi:tRNA dimethylallyltransferase
MPGPTDRPTPVLALFGPTAAGKSALAHAAARRLDGEIVVADPFQRYRGLEIAADAPSLGERAEAPYHFVGDLALHEASTAGEFGARAHTVIDDIITRGRLAIVTGGTALYLRAALTDLGFPPTVPPDVRAWSEGLVADDPDAARRELCRRDPDAAARIDLANPRRLARALELAALPPDAERPTDRLWDGSMRRSTWLATVVRPREELDRLIAIRVRRELDDGLADEIARVLDTPGVSREALQIIGAREIAGIRAGDIDPAALPDLLAARTRRLARRQLAWARRWPDALTIDLGTAPAVDALDRLLDAWRSFGGEQRSDTL